MILGQCLLSIDPIGLLSIHPAQSPRPCFCICNLSDEFWQKINCMLPMILGEGEVEFCHSNCFLINMFLKLYLFQSPLQSLLWYFQFLRICKICWASQLASQKYSFSRTQDPTFFLYAKSFIILSSPYILVHKRNFLLLVLEVFVVWVVFKRRRKKEMSLLL